MTGLATYIAAVELVLAAQAVDLRGARGELGKGTGAVYALVREHVPFCGSARRPRATSRPRAGARRAPLSSGRGMSRSAAPRVPQGPPKACSRASSASSSAELWVSSTPMLCCPTAAK